MHNNIQTISKCEARRLNLGFQRNFKNGFEYSQTKSAFLDTGKISRTMQKWQQHIPRKWPVPLPKFFCTITFFFCSISETCLQKSIDKRHLKTKFACRLHFSPKGKLISFLLIPTTSGT